MEEEEDWPFSEPRSPDEEAMLSSLLDGAANALRASPMAEDATLLSRLSIADGADASSCFDSSAVNFPFPFESLIVKYIEIHSKRQEEQEE